jgi:hypothetical protein
MATLRIIPITAKPGTMPYLNPSWEGQRHGVTTFFQIPLDLVVKRQTFDIAEVISLLI